ncbi:MAG: hypothetical protein WD423_09090 [Rhodothermales bacterium]
MKRRDILLPNPARALLLALFLALILMAPATPRAVQAQSLDLTVRDYGLSIGDASYVNGVRLNFRDRNLQVVNGLNLTLWEPHEPVEGIVRGIAIGLPQTGARRIHGVGLGLFGVSAHESATGIIVGGLGTGVGQDLVGVAVGGLGVGSGRDVRGVAVGGLGVGAGGDLSGIAVGGLGVGGGGDVHGIMIGGLGAGAGGNLSGIAVGGLGVGAGGTIRGLAVSGAGVGAPTIRGLVLSAVAAGTTDIVGIAVAPGYFHVEENGRMKGLSISAFNRIRGTQQGLTIGILNVARHLNGVQVGLLNIAHNNPRGLRVLPFLNVHVD